MKKAFGLLELLIVAVVIVLVFIMCNKSGEGVPNIFDFQESAKAVKQKDKINEQVKEIENIRNQGIKSQQEMLENFNEQ